MIGKRGRLAELDYDLTLHSLPFFLCPNSILCEIFHNHVSCLILSIRKTWKIGSTEGVERDIIDMIASRTE